MVARDSVMKDLCEPSSNNRLALVCLGPFLMVATAVFSRHAVFCDGEAVADKDADSAEVEAGGWFVMVRF